MRSFVAFRGVTFIRRLLFAAACRLESRMLLLRFIVDFADPGLVIALAIGVGSFFAMSRWYHGAVIWLIAAFGGLAVIGLLKLVFIDWCSLSNATGIHSPSGHTTAAIIIYGGPVLALSRGRSPAWLDIALPVGIATAIACMLMSLGVHTLTEVTIGAAVGLVAVWVIARYMPERPHDLKLTSALMVGILIIFVLHGRRLRAEDLAVRLENTLVKTTTGCSR